MSSIGPKYPASPYQSSGGFLTTTPENCVSDNAQYATGTSTTRNQNSATYWRDFDFSTLPDGATITQIDVVGQFQISATGITGAGCGIQLYHTGTTAVGSEVTGTTPTADTDYDRTQTITTGFPTVAQLKTTGDSGLRVNTRVYTGNTPTSRTWRLDYVSITIQYTAGTTYQGTASPVACAVTASSGSRTRQRTSEAVATAVATATGSRTRARTADAVSAAVATASGTKLTTKNATADVVCAVVSTGTGSAVQGQTKQGTASVSAVASTGGTTSDSLTVWAGTGDGYVYGSSSDYAAARSTGSYAETSYTYSRIGQDWTGVSYACYELFEAFDTSSVGAGSTVTTATLSLYGNDDSSFTDFTIQARISDWGASLTTGDYRSGNPADANSLDEYTLVATRATSSGWSTSAYNALTSDAAFLTNIAQAGTTYVLCDSDRHLGGNTPTGSEYVRAYNSSDATGGGGTDRDPKLYVEWTAGGGGPTGSRIRERTADVAATVVATATGSKVRQGTASVTAVASTGGVTSDSLTVWSGTADGRVSSDNASYDTARSTADYAPTTETTTPIAGQLLRSGPFYACYESFYAFNTSSVGASSTVTVATLSHYGFSDSSVTNFTIQARIFDWGGTLTVADFRSGNPADSGSLDEYTLVATYASSGWSISAYNVFTSETAFLSNIAQAGTTYTILNSDRHLAGTTPSGDEYVNAYMADDTGTDRDPKLYVEWTEGGGGPTGSRIRSRTADAPCAVVATATGSKVRQATASVTAVASTGGVTSDSLTVWSTTADGQIAGQSTTYATARSTGAYVSTTQTTRYVGQQYSDPTYTTWEYFAGFDTSTVGSGSTVTVATMSLYPVADYSTTNFTINIKPRDWGGTLTVADWVSGNPADTPSLDELTLVATYATSSGWSGAAYKSFTSQAAFLSNIAQAGTTYLMAASDRHEAGNTPTNDEFVEYYTADDATGGGGTDRDPKLYVEWTAGGGGPTGSRIRSRTADAPCAVVATATGSKVRQATASVTAVASTGGVTSDSLTVWSTTADGIVYSQSTTYATARSGNMLDVSTASAICYVGQDFIDPDYSCYETCVSFDTSSVGAGSTVTVATQYLWSTVDSSVTNFVFQARIKDWGAELTTADWVAGADLDDNTLVASKDTSGWSTGAYLALTSESAFLTNIAQAGTTYIQWSSSRHLNGDTPTGFERVTIATADDATGGGGTDRDPKLYVEWTAGGGGPTGSRIRQRDASVTACVETLATGEKAGGTTKQGTADVSAVAVTDSSAGALRPRTGTADAPAVATAAGGALRPRTATPVACAAATAAGKRIRLASASVVACADATAQAGEVEVTTASVVAAADATASGARIRSRTASVVACADATASAGEIEVTTASVYAVVVSAATGGALRPRSAEIYAVVHATAVSGGQKAGSAEVAAAAVASASGARVRQRSAEVVAPADAAAAAGALRTRTSEAVTVAVATATGQRVSRRTSSVFAVAVGTADAGALRQGTASSVATVEATASGGGGTNGTAAVSACAESTATGAAIRSATASVACVAASSSSAKNICAVTFTEPHDNDRYERTVAGTIAWTCTPVENVTFHLWAVARGSAVEYYLKDVAADGTGSYSTTDGFEIPPGQFRMKAVVD